ncbi:hypothetical protein I203_103434 [Kwoniella mangroviensis CBS 8507]|uniref:uncharacterized protein n=1 Tax=Kwoniella mangroviensis CBS 8507 TaxID=1296122 RepID=UPI00302A1980
MSNNIELDNLSTNPSLSDLQLALNSLREQHQQLGDLISSQNQSDSGVEYETRQATRLSYAAIGRQITQVRTQINSQNATSSSSRS